MTNPASTVLDHPASVMDAIAPLLGVFAVSFGLTLVLTPVMRKLAVKNGIVDWPDLKRKSHIEPVAYLGGVALFLGWLGGVVFSLFRIYPFTPEGPINVAFPIPIIFGATIITLTGLADDVFGMSPRVKVGGQLITAAALTWKSELGKRLATDVFLFAGLDGLAGNPHVVYIVGALVMTFMVVGGCNSLNLLDGLDGLASGVAGIAALGFLFVAAYVVVFPEGVPSHNAVMFSPVRIAMCLAIFGAILGFLPYNFNPANIFMGDAGSLLLGYLCVSTILMFAEVPNVGPKLVMAALIIFSLPIADTTLALVRRKMRGAPIFSPDNQHLHHILHRAAKRIGLGPQGSVKVAVFAMYALAAMFAIMGCTLVMLYRWRYVLVAFFVIFGFILVVAYKAGHRYALLAKMGTAPPPLDPSIVSDTSPPASPAATSIAPPGEETPASHADTSHKQG